MERVEHTFPAFYDSSSKILILGSMPSVKSREEGFYYMHPSNRFWLVLEHVYQEKIIDKKEFLKRHHIALWDVLSSCLIDGSKDASIKDIEVNDITSLLSKTNIKYIYTTGKTAYTLYQKYIYPETKIKAVALPSTSSANAKASLPYLVKSYSIIKEKE